MPSDIRWVTLPQCCPLNPRGLFQVYFHHAKAWFYLCGNDLLLLITLGPKTLLESSALCWETPSSGPSRPFVEVLSQTAPYLIVPMDHGFDFRRA